MQTQGVKGVTEGWVRGVAGGGGEGQGAGARGRGRHRVPLTLVWSSWIIFHLI